LRKQTTASIPQPDSYFILQSMSSQPAIRSIWKLPLFGISAAVAANLPGLISGNGLLPFVLTGVLPIVSGVIVLAVAAANIRRKLLSSLATIVAFSLVAWLLFKFSYDIYAAGRWLAHSEQYKAAVLAQPQPPNGELKHIEWDGWGMAGSGDTTVYLVFDPDDRLPSASVKADRLTGLPCPVWRTKRLGPHWDYVVFYTDTGWAGCP